MIAAVSLRCAKYGLIMLTIYLINWELLRRAILKRWLELFYGSRCITVFWNAHIRGVIWGWRGFIRGHLGRGGKYSIPEWRPRYTDEKRTATSSSFIQSLGDAKSLAFLVDILHYKLRFAVNIDNLSCCNSNIKYNWKIYNNHYNIKNFPTTIQKRYYTLLYVWY